MSELLLAILGRGIQMPKEQLDPTELDSWEPTNIFEITDERGAHLPVRDTREGDENVDEHPNVRIGGSWWNLQAGVSLIKQHRPTIAVCAYGDRSSYLKSVNGPTESEVMSAQLEHFLGENETEVIVWPREKKQLKPSNTGSEIENIFNLALARSVSHVQIVTMGVHVPRTATYVAKYQSTYSDFAPLNVAVAESEVTLLRARPNDRDIIARVRSSKAFALSWASEADGIQKIIRDAYKDFA
jgi:hypothetical protein